MTVRTNPPLTLAETPGSGCVRPRYRVRIDKAVTLQALTLLVTTITGLQRPAGRVAVMLRPRNLAKITAPAHRVKTQRTLRFTEQAREAAAGHGRALMTVGAEAAPVVTCLAVKTAPGGIQAMGHDPIGRMQVHRREWRVMAIKTLGRAVARAAGLRGEASC